MPSPKLLPVRAQSLQEALPFSSPGSRLVTAHLLGLPPSGTACRSLVARQSRVLSPAQLEALPGALPVGLLADLHVGVPCASGARRRCQLASSGSLPRVLQTHPTEAAAHRGAGSNRVRNGAETQWADSRRCVGCLHPSFCALRPRSPHEFESKFQDAHL